MSVTAEVLEEGPGSGLGDPKRKGNLVSLRLKDDDSTFSDFNIACVFSTQASSVGFLSIFFLRLPY
jgi:hypothetical protein